MNYYKEDFKDFITKHKEDYNYAIIDPPWNYNDKPPAVTNNQLTYNLWENKDLQFIFDNLKVDYLFIWVTNSMLPELFNFKSIYIYKSLITWVKQTTKGNLFYGLGNYFRNCTEHMAVFIRKDKKVKPLRLALRNIIFEPAGKRTIKPKLFERNLVNKLQEKGFKGIYIFSGGPLDFIDSNDII